MKLRCVGLATACVLASGCASIISDSDYPVSIQSTPSAAQFEVFNRGGERVYAGVTPELVTLPAGAGFFKGEEYTVRFVSEDGAPVEVMLKSHMDDWYWGNILAGGLLGMLVVDPATGSMFALPRSIHATLDGQAHGRTDDRDRQLRVTTLDRVPREQRDKLIAL